MFSKLSLNRFETKQKKLFLISDDIKDSESHEEKSIAKSEEIKTNLKVTTELVLNHSSSITSESSDNEIRDNADELNEQHNEEKVSNQNVNNLNKLSTKSVLLEKEVQISLNDYKTSLKNKEMTTTEFFLRIL
jgi:diketogulonate reductase-like aldo/keto reductase